MKIRTREMLSDYLASDLAWRKKELTDIRQLVQLAANASRRRVLARCGVALLYAHFEGFTRQAGRAYLEYVAAQRLPNDRLARNFLAVMLCDLMSPVAVSRKPSSYSRAVELFLDEGASRAWIPYKTAVDTESNLSSKVLREIVFTLGLDYAAYETKEKLIDSRLLARRNHIAHGESIDIDDADYDELHGSVIGILNCMRNQIDNAAAQRAFARSA
jgi:MAE_28990/MAE_18760-like HEPN